MKIGIGAGTVVLMVLAGCGPNDIDLGGRGGDDDRGDVEPNTGGTSGSSAGGSGAYGNAGAAYGGGSIGGTGGTGIVTCWENRIENTSCQPQHVFVTFAEETCASDGATFSSFSLDLCAEGDTAIAANFTCCREGGAGGTGGSEPTAGNSSGGVSYGGTTSAGGTSAGSSSYGGTFPVGGTSAGGSSYGGTSAGGNPAGGAGGSIPGTTGGTGGGPGEECWSTGIGSSNCADNDLFLGRGYERCELSGGTLSSITYTAPCDAYTSLAAEITCCRSLGGVGGAAGTTGAGGTQAGSAGAN
jgi:hypothetical protein